MVDQAIKTRFCPSPTGNMHLGNARTALFNALMARKQKGTFLLRIEDTDLVRSKDEHIQGLMRDLRWLGLDWQEGPECERDAGPYRQSERQAIYNQYYGRLEKQGQAYPCFCTEQQLAIARKVQLSSGQPPRYAGTCRHFSESEITAKLEEGLTPTLRFRIPDGEHVEFDDLVRGAQRFATDDIGDFIIRRTDGTSPFMFCNAIDDSLMGVTHVLRGEDHLTNTPRQLLIYRALELREPHYAHINLITGSDGAPLSKRNGSRGMIDLHEAGYFPDALINYMARLGHHYVENHEQWMTLEALSDGFGFEGLGTSPTRYDDQQLLFWQKQTILQYSDEVLWEWMKAVVSGIVPEDDAKNFVALIRPNIAFPNEAEHWAHALCSDKLDVDEDAKTVLNTAGWTFFEVAEKQVSETGCDRQALCQALEEHCGVKGKRLFMPLRIALTGVHKGPELADILKFMGTARVQARFAAIKKQLEA